MQGKSTSAITGLTLNRATFVGEQVGGLTFVNFFYGRNGAGKSSVARAIEENDGVIWADGETAADYDVLVYNRDYTDRCFAAFDSLPGVFILGEEDIEAKRKLQKLTEERKKKSDECSAALEQHSREREALALALAEFQNKCFGDTDTVRRRFEKCMDGKKQKKNFAEAVLNEKNPTEHDITELERLYDTAYDDSARVYTEFRRVSPVTSYGSLPGRELLNKMIVSSSDTPFAGFIKKLGDTAFDWVREGHTHYSAGAGEDCPYCHQKLPASFEADIAACFDAQYQQNIRDLGKFCETYEIETAEVVRQLKNNLNDVMPSLSDKIKSYQDKLAQLDSRFEINRRRLAEKVKEPSGKISLEDTDTLLLEIGGMIDDINRLINDNNAVVAEKRANKVRCKTMIMEHLAYMLAAEVQRYHDEVGRLNKELEDIVRREKQLKEEIADIDVRISELNRHNADTGAAVDSINKMLQNSGFQGFGIRAGEDEENVYEVVRQDGTVAENLSEGERSFIAFLYFCHQVRGSMRGDVFRNKIVVIDDPVSGMDGMALSAASAIVREMIISCRNSTKHPHAKAPGAAGGYIRQLFILTHNVYFHREITYRQTGYYNCESFYIIRKNDDISRVKLCIRQRENASDEYENYNPVQNSYAALWEELRDVRSVIPALNIMRKILEYYFIRLCGYDGNELRETVLNREGNRYKFIRQVPGKQPDMTGCRLASAMLAYTGSPSSISDESACVEDCEDVNAYRRVFKMIFEIMGQSQHYKMMTGEKQ